MGRFEDLHLTLLGEHQVINAAVAIQIIMLLRNLKIDVSRENIYNAINNASFIGRLDVIREKPVIVLDGAHNEASAVCLKDSLTKLFSFKKLFLVIGMSMNKNIKAFADVLCPLAYEVILTKSNSPRAAEPDKLLKEEFSPYSDKVVCTQNIDEAIKYVLLKASDSDLICFTGSFYVLADIMKSKSIKHLKN
jgi:dihydrofolate synthase/folylpolyglutamate synthase